LEKHYFGVADVESGVFDNFTAELDDVAATDTDTIIGDIGASNAGG